MGRSESSCEFNLGVLEELGGLLRTSAYHGEDISCALPVRVRDVLEVVMAMGGRAPSLSEGFALVTGYWQSAGEFSSASQARLAEVLARAVARAERLGVECWDDRFDQMVCDKFIWSVTTSNAAPSASTMHLRRSALRAAFVTLRRLGLFTGDPTLDIVLPARSQLAARAATDDEIVLLRMHAVTERASRQPTVLALAETTATTSELPLLTGLLLDDPVSPSSVLLPGSKGVRSRTGLLSEWGGRVLAREMAVRRSTGVGLDVPLVYAGDGSNTASPQASVCVALRKIFERAGLSRESDLRPRSVRFWAARQVFDAASTGRLEAAALAIGSRSLDRVAAQIDYSWDQP